MSWSKVLTLPSVCFSPCIDPSNGDLVVASSAGEIVRISDKDGVVNSDLQNLVHKRKHYGYLSNLSNLVFNPNVLTRTQGQAQGVGFDAAGRLLVCDTAMQAIFSLGDDGELAPVVSEYEEKAFKDADIGMHIRGCIELHISKILFSFDRYTRHFAEKDRSKISPLNAPGPSSVAVDSTQTVYFTDSGPMGATSLQNPAGSVFAISGTAQVLQPLALHSLAHPCALCLAPVSQHADPSLAPLYVCEMGANRVLRFAQSPKGVYHSSVFYQFSGGMGPSSIACDAQGHIFVSRFEFNGLGCNGYISVLDAEGKLLRELPSPAPEVTGIAVGGDSTAFLYVTEQSTKSIYRCSVEEIFNSA